MKSSKVLCVVALAMTASTEAFTTVVGNDAFSSTALMARGGRGKKKIETGGGMPSGSTSTASGYGTPQWYSMPTEPWDMTKAKEGKVELFNTNLQTLKDSLTNPTGAVSVLRHKEEIYCFGSTCPSCKIPMSGAKVLPVTASRPTPLIACTFCKSTYDLKSGQKIDVSADEIGGGMFAGLTKTLFKASGNADPLKIYQLGEKDGSILINLA
jgi:nitrite reductase/ring-hydroxylating ferredoxin subunit